MTYLTIGDPAPWFTAQTDVNENFIFSTVAGRYVIINFLGHLDKCGTETVAKDWGEAGGRLNPSKEAVFHVISDPRDQVRQRFKQHPAVIAFWDENETVAELFGAKRPGKDGVERYHPCTVICDHNLRVLGVLYVTEPEGHTAKVYQHLRSLPDAPGAGERQDYWAPVLQVPRVFEPAFCEQLLDYYATHDPEETGFMRDVDGKTRAILDHKMKRRSDVQIADETLRAGARQRLIRRLVPEIKKAFQYEATRVERYIVACYESEGGGYFNAHRDNTTKGTAHRRFAVTINLNAEDYDGGELRFPEYGQQSYKAPTGGAVVFSCSLLHQALPVKSGTRFCFLPFLYDDAAAKIRQMNMEFVEKGPTKPIQAEKPSTTS